MSQAPLPYRGFMLDPARHFMSAEDVCKIIEAAALCGMNRMHWHLTDDQGWRIEIKKYPRLTQVGSVREVSYFGDRFSETENNCGFYTQEEIRHVVAFAREKGVEIVPEIEVPGHASAMLAAYPQYGCRRVMAGPEGEEVIDAPYTCRVMTYAGIFPNLICAGQDEAIRFLEDILDEVTELFPGPEIHIGGDEAVKMHWRRCPDCQRRMRENGLRDEKELQRWLVLKIGAYLADKGKRTIVWNESLEGGLLPRHFIVQHWQGNDEETQAFMRAGGQVICSDIRDYYINRHYGDIDAHHLWQLPTVPPYAQEHPEQLLGLECPLWSELITNSERAAYLLFPRLTAVALKARQPDAHPSWEEFLQALRDRQRAVEALGLKGAPEEMWHLAPEAAQALQVEEAAARQAPRLARVFEICDQILRQEQLERLLQAIHMPRPFALRVMDCAWADQREFFGDRPADPSRGADELARHLLIALKNRQDGPWKGLPENVWLDTLQCFTRFVNEHYASCGVYGFDRGFWTARQINARLFRIGELEYELLEKEDGSRVISLHIPSDARLEAPLLNASVEGARAFLEQYFPAWAQTPMACESWLLSKQLKDLLPSSSRILAFQRAFDLTFEEENSLDAVLEWVYKLTPDQQKNIRLDALPEHTSLQRRMKEYLLSGGIVRAAGGTLARPFAQEEQP